MLKKKNAWIAALVLALVIMASMGCQNGQGPLPPKEVEWKLSDYLSDDFDMEAQSAIILAGSPDISVDSKGIEITTIANWGEGIDLLHSYFQFAVGDIIKVTGKAINTFPDAPAIGDTWATPIFYLKANPFLDNPQKQVSGPQANAALSLELELDAEMITGIITIENQYDAEVVRIGGRPAGASFLITEIVVTGFRHDSFEFPEE